MRKKRILCLVISLLMILTAIPFSASAENAEDSLSEVGCAKEWFTIRNMLEESYPLVDDTSFTYESRMALKEVLDYVTSVYIRNDGGCIELIEGAVNALVPVDNTNTRYELRASYNSWNTTSISANITADTITHEEILDIPAGTHGFKILNTASNVWYGSEDIIYDGCEDYSLTTTTADATIMATGGTYQLTINYESEDTLNITITPLELITTASTDPVETTTPPVITEPTDPVEVTDPTESNEPFTTFSDDYYDDDHDYELDCNCWMYLLLDSTIYEAEELLASDTLYTPESRANLERVLAIAKEQQGMFVADDPLGLVADLDEAISAMVIMSTETTPDEQIFLYGDADADSRITIRDASLIQKHLVELIKLSEDILMLCDVNKDSTININDATTIQKFLAELDFDGEVNTPFTYPDVTIPDETTPDETTPDYTSLLKEKTDEARAILFSDSQYTADTIKSLAIAYNEAAGFIITDKTHEELYNALCYAMENLIPDQAKKVPFTIKKTGFVSSLDKSFTLIVNSRAQAQEALDASLKYNNIVLGDEYDDAYFENNTLIIAFTIRPNLGIEERIHNVRYQDGELVIEIRNYSSMNPSPAMMNYTYYFIEIPKTYADTEIATLESDHYNQNTIYFVADDSWDEHYVYSFYANAIDGDNVAWPEIFPGVQMSKTSMEYEDKPVYKATLLSDLDYILFSDHSENNLRTILIPYTNIPHGALIITTDKHSDARWYYDIVTDFNNSDFNHF